MTLFRWEKPLYIFCMGFGVLNLCLWMFAGHQWLSLFAGIIGTLIGTFCYYSAVDHDRRRKRIDRWSDRYWSDYKQGRFDK